MFRWLVVLAVLTSTVASAGDEPSNADNGTPLDKTVTISAGDIAATQIALFFATGIVKQEFDAPVLTQFDRAAKKLIITIIGSRSNVEGARKTLDDFQRIIVPFSKGILEKQHGIRLNDSNTTIVYLVRSGYGESAQLKEVLRRENGKFITP